MGDEFSETAAKTLEFTAEGAAGIAGTLLAGPGGGIAAVAGVMTAVDWLQRRAEQNDGALFEARLSAVEEQCRRLDERMREREIAGAKIDRTDFLSKEAVYSEFAKSVAEAATPGKREALVNAAARQFDPEMGAPAARAYWFQIVRQCSDIQLQLIALLDKHTELHIQHSPPKVRNTVNPPENLSLPEPDCVALFGAGVELAKTTDVGQLVTQKANTFSLAPRGKVVALFIR